MTPGTRWSRLLEPPASEIPRDLWFLEGGAVLNRSQKDLIQAEFTKQAPAYAANASVADPERVARLVAAANPAPESRVLDVATGPGFVAIGFAAVCHQVVGVDLTTAPLQIAERQRHDRGLTNLRFLVGDAECLPFASGTFDVVVCRLAFHHVTEPRDVLREMVRVCRAGGTIAVEDLVVSEHPERAAYHNHFENLRDPSHTRGIPLSELLGMFAAAGLEIQYVHTDRFPQHLARWLANAQTPPTQATEVRALVARDLQEDRSGTQPRDIAGQITFLHTIATVIGRRLPDRR